MKKSDYEIPPWLAPDIFPPSSPACRDFLTDTSPEVFAEGPTRTGKTHLGLLKLITLHFLIPGYKSGIVRATNVDLDNTIRKDLSQVLFRYDLEDPRSPIRALGGPTRFHTLIINEGECVLAGMNRPKRVLGTEFDGLMISQLEQITQEQYEILLTRVSGTAGNWVDEFGNPMFQIWGDLNPATPDFFGYEREKANLTRFIQIGFRDNAYFYRNNRWSRTGFSTVQRLSKSLTGIYRQRYFLGERVAAEGAVFHIRPEHLIDVLPDMRDYLFYNLMDFGVSKSPNVCLWLAWNPAIDDIVVFREFARTHTDTITFGRQMNDINAVCGEPIRLTLTDDDINLVKILRRECGINPIQTARKGAGSIVAGLDHIEYALAQTVLGKPGGLRIYTGLVYGGKDPNPDANDDNLIIELRNLRWDENKPETVVPGRDHRIDPLRYWFLWRHKGVLRPGSGGSTVGALNA